MKRLGKTPPFLGPRSEPVPGSIAEITYLRLGGVDQWVMIRGESLANPPLILLHGGPGFSEMRLFRHFNAPLEKSFTVVNWDQRGAGKSFDRKIPRSSMTVEQFIADLDELVEAVRKRLGTGKVAIFGHSWGSALGVLYAARFPEKVAAYVGSGQIGDWPAGESSSYAFALAEAQRRNNRKGLKELLAIGRPPHTASRLWTEREWLQRFEGQLGGRALWNMGRIVLGGPESSVFDLPNLLRGFRFSLDAMWAEVSALNLLKQAPALRMPVFFFLGRRDHWVPPEISVAYFDALTAPSKKLVWFEESGHEPFVDEPAKFNTAMVELVRPLAASDGGRSSEHRLTRAG
jgi:pimeloyl-ACP methyl ester carboxylesterase